MLVILIYFLTYFICEFLGGNEEGNNGVNAINAQSKVLPLNFRRNSVAILTGYDIKDINSVMDFIDKEKSASKKVIEDDKEKENFNNIISNKYAFEVELEKYTNYIQKRPNSTVIFFIFFYFFSENI